ncbi:hypothetical protein BKA70DRAFT_1266247 [Coprinopsis sp. MPI-PUGE-AT-0042]|nr:hypothetical protein BKA70DRAFT_1266247 [Coprinopsis sp. MPI-PUGE-AT-0042]
MASSTSRDRVTISVPIILLGSTGCGKSSFVNAVVGDRVAVVGAGIRPATNEIALYTFTVPSEGSIDLQCLLVDTPGFGFNHQHHRWERTTDLAILQGVESLLREKFKAEKEEGRWGVIFLHNKCAPEVNWEAEQRTTAVFTRLAGGDALRNLVVVTTSPHQEGYQVETGLLKELRDRGIQPVCSNSFGDPYASHPQCGEVQTPRQIVEHLVALVLKAEAEECNSDSPSDDESDNDWDGDEWPEQPPDDDTAFLPPHPNAAPMTLIQILHSTFNDVGGNQTNIYGHSETSQTPEPQPSQQNSRDPRTLQPILEGPSETSHPELNDPHETSQPDLDVLHGTSQPNLDIPCESSQPNLGDPRQTSQQTPDEQNSEETPKKLQDTFQETPDDPQVTLQETPNNLQQRTSQEIPILKDQRKATPNLDEPRRARDQEARSSSMHKPKEVLAPASRFGNFWKAGCCRCICCCCVVM